jgi:hypothetical protein
MVGVDLGPGGLGYGNLDLRDLDLRILCYSDFFVCVLCREVVIGPVYALIGVIKNYIFAASYFAMDSVTLVFNCIVSAELDRNQASVVGPSFPDRCSSGMLT